MSEQKRVRPKPITPYQRLLETAKELAFSVMHPKRVHMLWWAASAKTLMTCLSS